jgi:hypothetical protein
MKVVREFAEWFCELTPNRPGLFRGYRPTSTELPVAGEECRPSCKASDGIGNVGSACRQLEKKMADQHNCGHPRADRAPAPKANLQPRLRCPRLFLSPWRKLSPAITGDSSQGVKSAILHAVGGDYSGTLGLQ